MAVLEKIKKAATKVFSLMQKEASTLQMLNGECQAAVNRLDQAKPGFRAFLEKAHAYAVFPSVGKAAAVLGGAFGKGEVFEQGKLVGYAAVAQLTIGVQIGGDTFIEVVVFESKEALNRFKQGKTSFAANASAVLVKAAAAAASDFEKGAAVYVHSDGGMMLEAAIGGQHFFFRPAFLGRSRLAPTALKRPSRGKRVVRKTKAKSAKPRSGKRRASRVRARSSR